MAQIFHNPNCGTSRNVLALLRHFGMNVEIVEYLKDVPSKEQLSKLIADAGLSVRAAIRDKQPEFTELGLADPALSDETLLDAMTAHPILINRPFVVTSMGTRLARPSEVVLEILPKAGIGPFFKEDGTEVLREGGMPL